jgi:hypothetical protein
MRADPAKQVAQSRVASSVAAEAGAAWRPSADAVAAPGEGRLGWPLAAGVIVLLSAGLWLGIGWLAHLVLG